MLLLIAAAAGAVETAPLAFPTAEGAGRHALGGRGGQVLKVTTLASMAARSDPGP
jgi:hypothetical protein